MDRQCAHCVWSSRLCTAHASQHLSHDPSVAALPKDTPCTQHSLLSRLLTDAVAENTVLYLIAKAKHRDIFFGTAAKLVAGKSGISIADIYIQKSALINTEHICDKSPKTTAAITSNLYGTKQLMAVQWLMVLISFACVWWSLWMKQCSIGCHQSRCLKMKITGTPIYLMSLWKGSKVCRNVRKPLAISMSEYCYLCLSTLTSLAKTLDYWDNFTPLWQCLSYLEPTIVAADIWPKPNWLTLQETLFQPCCLLPLPWPHSPHPGNTGPFSMMKALANGIFGTHHSGSLYGTPSHPLMIPNYGMPPTPAEQGHKESGTTTWQGGWVLWKIVEDFLEVTKIGRVSII